ncbi:BTB/POZ domain-containing protein At5g66560 [Prosopis cineraria]|uniref:BTB/POZ domain-containing protein At5g66560 n=1 Tax=Prosopis cineraria TaxID=364024 RepID=UPI0024104771|nr:BTB/POZ domain-containing protein At5g66560 [Prosopis cineraria]
MAEAETSSSKGQAWFCTNGLPSDIIIEVDDMSFHLHKFPLMAKSRKLHQQITEQESNHPPSAKTQASGIEEAKEEDEIAEEHCHITFTDFPGGSEAFEMAAKFCYGVKIDLSASNVAPLRCAAEFLEMTEEYSEDNLISKTERFLSQSVLKNIKDSIKALKSIESLMPLSETLAIPQRCIDSVVSRAPSANPALFGWPVTDAGANDATTRSSLSKQVLWNGIESRGRRKSVPRGDSWFEDLGLLSLPLFKQLIHAMRGADLSPDIIESCLMYYAKKHIPGASRSSRRPMTTSSSSSSSSSVVSKAEQKELLEFVLSNLPLKKSSGSPTATRFLFGLLRTANILDVSEAGRDALEKKIGSQLEEATLDDLLIPSYSYLNETLYDVDCVERILAHFLAGLEERNAAAVDGDGGVTRSPSLMVVGKLIDGYLSEIASDANLKPDKFYNFALSLPSQARLFDDGLYRAVDVFLKAHPRISEAERENICGVLDCQKLTLEACTHAAQNERLPLRAVVQVLFFEQLQLRHAIAGTLMAAEAASEPGRPSAALRREEEGDGEIVAGAQDSINAWRVAVRENQVLRLDMDSMRTRVHQLERECSSMKKVVEKIDKSSPQRQQRSGWRKKFGCTFKTQVCDSHESAVADRRQGRSQQQQRRDHPRGE